MFELLIVCCFKSFSINFYLYGGSRESNEGFQTWSYSRCAWPKSREVSFCVAHLFLHKPSFFNIIFEDNWFSHLLKMFAAVKFYISSFIVDGNSNFSTMYIRRFTTHCEKQSSALNFRPSSRFMKKIDVGLYLRT